MHSFLCVCVLFRFVIGTDSCNHHNPKTQNCLFTTTELLCAIPLYTHLPHWRCPAWQRSPWYLCCKLVLLGLLDFMSWLESRIFGMMACSLSPFSVIVFWGFFLRQKGKTRLGTQSFWTHTHTPLPLFSRRLTIDIHYVVNNSSWPRIKFFIVTGWRSDTDENGRHEWNHAV